MITKSNFGGAQRYVYDLAIAMKGRQHDVTVALGGTGAQRAETGKLKTLLDEHGIRTILVENFMRDMSLIRDIRALFEIIRLVFRERPDVLHANSSKAGGLGAFAGRLCGVKRILFTSHGLTFDETWRPLWQRVLIRYATWLTILLSHKTITISRDTMESAQRLGFVKNKVRLIYNGIQEPNYKSRNEARDHLYTLSTSKPKKDGFWIGTIAELHPNKNLDVVVDALATLGSNGTDMEFIAMGDGEVREQLLEHARGINVLGRVHLPGFVEHAAEYTTAFDTFILPSKKEGLPYVLLEAGLAGLPIVASDISGNRDIIEHEASGLLVPPDDPQAIGNALMTYITNPERARKHGAALKRKVKESFSIQKMVTETEALYH